MCTVFGAYNALSVKGVQKLRVASPLPRPAIASGHLSLRIGQDVVLGCSLYGVWRSTAATTHG